jgi:hypothetical protein
MKTVDMSNVIYIYIYIYIIDIKRALKFVAIDKIGIFFFFYRKRHVTFEINVTSSGKKLADIMRINRSR